MSTQPPREFWVGPGHDFGRLAAVPYGPVPNYIDESNLIHVIEYGELEKANARAEKYRKALEWILARGLCMSEIEQMIENVLKETEQPTKE